MYCFNRIRRWVGAAPLLCGHYLHAHRLKFAWRN